MKCPSCNKEIDEEILFCEDCGIRFRKCPRCGRVYGSWVLVCMYCGESLLGRRAVEVSEEGEAKAQVIPLVFPEPGAKVERFAKMELQGAEPYREPPSYEEAFPTSALNASESREAEAFSKRVKVATTEYDEEELRRKEQREMLERLAKLKRDESINPRRLQRALAIPVYLFIFSLLILASILDSRASFLRSIVNSAYLFIGVLILGSISIVWCVIVILVDALRRWKGGEF